MMRLLVLGAGGIGGYFGGRLVEKGVDVTFLVRPQRAAQLASSGLSIRSPLGDTLCEVKTVVSAAGGVYDAILIACKAYDLDSALDAVRPAVGPSTVLLPLLNGLRHLDYLDDRFSAEKVLGGLCHIGVTLGERGEIVHLNRLQHFAFGPRQGEQQAVASVLHATLDQGGFAPVLSSSIVHAMWEKFVLLATYAGMTCLMRASIGQIVSTETGEQVMIEALAECTAVARASGFPPRQDFLDETRRMLTERGSSNTASMLRDVRRGARTEHEHVLGDMMVRAQRCGVEAPLMRLAYTHLQAYEASQKPVGA